MARSDRVNEKSSPPSSKSLAQRIVAGDVPESLRDSAWCPLDVSSMPVQKYRGEFGRSRRSWPSLRTGQIITIVEGDCTVVKCGRRFRGAMDAGSMLKPCFHWPCAGFGATTLDEYAGIGIPGSGAASSRCSVSGPSVEDTVAILRGIAGSPQVTISSSALVAAATLSNTHHGTSAS